MLGVLYKTFLLMYMLMAISNDRSWLNIRKHSFQCLAKYCTLFIVKYIQAVSFQINKTFVAVSCTSTTQRCKTYVPGIRSLYNIRIRWYWYKENEITRKCV